MLGEHADVRVGADALERVEGHDPPTGVEHEQMPAQPRGAGEWLDFALDAVAGTAQVGDYFFAGERVARDAGTNHALRR